MARVQGPLMSMSASGTVGKAIVFSIWNGLAYVRRWLKPFNPKDPDQGDRRIILGGTGRAAGKVQVDSAIHAQLLDLNKIPAGQSKQSFLVQYVLDHYLADKTAYAAMLTEFGLHAADEDFTDAAATLGISDFDLGYATVEPYIGGLGVYLLAKTCIDLGFTGTPYTIPLKDWVAAQVLLFVEDFATVV